MCVRHVQIYTYSNICEGLYLFCSCLVHTCDAVEAHAPCYFVAQHHSHSVQHRGGCLTMSPLIATYSVSTFDANRKRPSVPHTKKNAAAPVASLSSPKSAKKDTSQGRGVADTVQWSVSKQKTMIAGVVVKLLNPYLNSKKITSKVLLRTLMHVQYASVQVRTYMCCIYSIP